MENRVRELRKERGLTQMGLGSRINVSQQVISGIERGKKSMAADILVQLERFFHVSADYILKISDTRMTVEYQIEFRKFPNKYMEMYRIYDLLNQENRKLIYELMTKLEKGQDN